MNAWRFLNNALTGFRYTFLYGNESLLEAFHGQHLVPLLVFHQDTLRLYRKQRLSIRLIWDNDNEFTMR